MAHSAEYIQIRQGGQKQSILCVKKPHSKSTGAKVLAEAIKKVNVIVQVIVQEPNDRFEFTFLGTVDRQGIDLVHDGMHSTSASPLDGIRHRNRPIDNSKRIVRVVQQQRPYRQTLPLRHLGGMFQLLHRRAKPWIGHVHRPRRTQGKRLQIVLERGIERRRD